MPNTSVRILLLVQLSFVVSAAQATPTTRQFFDAYGHRTTLESPLGGLRSYQHNYQGGESSVGLDGQTLVRDGVFSSQGLLEEYVYENLGPAPDRKAELGYDALGRPRRLSLERVGQPGPADYLADAFHYEERGFLTSYSRADSAVGNVALGFGYSAQGQLTDFEWGGQSLSYGYDSSGNLISRTGGLGVPSLGGASGVTYDAGNHRLGWIYDARGRLLEDDRYRYEYDALSRVRLIRDRESDAWVAHYLYDSSGNRVRVLEPDQVTYSYRDGSGGVLAEEVRGSDHEVAEQREHVTMGGRQVYSQTTGADGVVDRQHQFTDRLGNPVVSWTGAKTEVHEYSPFGMVLTVGASSPHEGAYGFTGHEDDGATGLTYMRARYYDKDSARFNRPDPARAFDPYLPATHNLYEYAYNNPVRFVDPTGEAPQTEDDWLVVLAASTPWPLLTRLFNWIQGETVAKNSASSLQEFAMEVRFHADQNGPIKRLRLEGHYGHSYDNLKNLSVRFVENPDHFTESFSLQSLLAEPDLESLNIIKSSLADDAVVILSSCYNGCFPEEAQELADILGRRVVVYDGEVLAGNYGAFYENGHKWTEFAPSYGEQQPE